MGEGLQEEMEDLNYWKERIKKILLNMVLRRRKEFGIGSMVERRRKLKERKKLN